MFTPTLRCECAQPASDRLMRKWCIACLFSLMSSNIYLPPGYLPHPSLPHVCFSSISLTNRPIMQGQRPSGNPPHRLHHRYRGEIPKLAAIFSRHGEQFGGIRFYSESACVNCIFLRYKRVFNRARKAATSATHIKVIARVICIANSPHLFSAKSRIPPNCSPWRGKNLRGRY